MVTTSKATAPEHEAPASQPLITESDVKKMKVPELRAALSSRGLDTKGLKADLTARLLFAITA